MRSYESIFIFPPEETPEARKKQLKNLEDLIQKFQGIVEQKVEWGKRPLGYPVKKFKEGYFILCDFQMEPKNIAEFRRNLELQEELVKFMVTLKNIRAVKKPSEKIRAPLAKSAHPGGGS
jgi:small subunit ribosomal protein S6